MITSIPGICKIGFVPCSKLAPQLMNKSLSGLPISIDTPIQFIRFTQNPLCRTNDTPNHNGRVQKSTLTFNTLDKIPLHYPIAFAIKCANGKSYLLGRHEPPFPSIKIEDTTGEAGGDPSTQTVEISFINLKTLLEVTF